MRTREVARRLEALDAGRPLPASDTQPLAVGDDSECLILAFVRMGGEALPWGVAAADLTGPIQFWTVPEPRDRDQVAAMLAEVTPVLIRHLQHPEVDTSGLVERAEHLPVRQLWVPNGSHTAMLHMLNLRYTFARRGPEDRIPLLNTLGRTAGWLFRDAQLPGRLNLVDAGAALRACFVFPTDEIRAQHTGYLLTLLTTEGSFDAREEAGKSAEGESVSVTLDPAVERDLLEPLVEKYQGARDLGERAEREAAAPIQQAIEEELGRRVELVRNVIQALRNDPRPVNPGVETLTKNSAESRLKEFIRREHRLLTGEQTFVVSPETDRPIPAAAEFFRLESAHEELASALLHYDRSLQDEAIATGDAFRGTIVEVRDEGEGRRKLPVWKLKSEGVGPLRIRERSTVCVAGLPNRTASVRKIEAPTDGARVFELEITGLTTRPRGPAGRNVPLATDAGLIGEEVTMLSGGAGGFGHRKASRAWDKEVPGAWLTHASGPTPTASGNPPGDGDVLAAVEAVRTG